MHGSTGMTINATKTLAGFTQTAGELSSFSQGNIEAIMKSGQAWAAGCQAISKTMVATSHSHFDRSVSAWKALIGVKSLKDAMELRRSLAHTSFETTCAEAGKFADASVRLAEETVAPIAERVTLAIEKFAHRVD
jgi:hypothetical protein